MGIEEEHMARSLFLVCLTGLICVAYCDSEDIGLTSLGKVMQIQEAMMGQSADRAGSQTDARRRLDGSSCASAEAPPNGQASKADCWPKAECRARSWGVG